MTLQQLTYLVTVADCGNITEAAEKLFISQPSLSAAIHNLEKEMGVTAFTRSNKGVTVTREGEELLSFARMLLEQADNMKEHFGNGERRTPKFSVSCQHYSFAVNAFVDLIKEYDAEQYSFIIRETQTGEIIEDVASGKSEIGVLYLSEHNEDVILKLIKNNQLKFEEMFVAEPHVFICKDRLEQFFIRCFFALDISFILKSDPLLCIIVFKKSERQRESREKAHDKYPFGLVNTESRHYNHREYKSHKYSAHHNCRYLIEYRERASLLGVSCGERHHQIVAHIKYCIGE